MNKYLLLIIISITFSTKCIAQENNDHLEPVNGIFDIYDFQFEYYSKVRNILFKGLSDSPSLRFLEMPSFSPENVLVIEQDRETEKYYLIYHICKESIWYSKDWTKVEVEKYKREIDENSTNQIKELFKQAIFDARYYTKNTFGADGTNYYFSVNDFNVKTGTVWSPPKDSKMTKLIKVNYALIDLAKKQSSSVISFDKELSDKIEKLVHEIK